MSISEDIPVEGEITVPVGSNTPDEDFSTLDEPVKDTVVSALVKGRDFHQISLSVLGNKVQK